MSILSRLFCWWHSFFIRHPRDNDYTYLQHLAHSWGLGFSLFKGSVALFVHGVFPPYFEKTGSTFIKQAYKKMNPIPCCPRSRSPDEGIPDFPGHCSTPYSTPIMDTPKETSIPDLYLTPINNGN